MFGFVLICLCFLCFWVWTYNDIANQHFSHVGISAVSISLKTECMLKKCMYVKEHIEHGKGRKSTILPPAISKY